MSALVTGSQDGAVPVLLLPLAGAVAVAGICAAAACALASRR